MTHWVCSPNTPSIFTPLPRLVLHQFVFWGDSIGDLQHELDQQDIGPLVRAARADRLIDADDQRPLAGLREKQTWHRFLPLIFEGRCAARNRGGHRPTRRSARLPDSVCDRMAKSAGDFLYFSCVSTVFLNLYRFISVLVRRGVARHGAQGGASTRRRVVGDGIWRKAAARFRSRRSFTPKQTLRATSTDDCKLLDSNRTPIPTRKCR